MHYIPLTEARSDEAKRIRKKNLRAGKDWTPYREKIHKLRTDGILSTLKTGLTRDHYVLVTRKSIHTLARYFGTISPTPKTMETSQKYNPKTYRTSIFSAADSLAKHLVSLGSDVDLTTPGARSFLKSQGYSMPKDLAYFSLKMLKDSSHMTAGAHSKSSSARLQSWGMTFNGKLLTARITESHKTGSGCTLSDILQERVDPKYFLSPKATQHILLRSLRAYQTRKGSTIRPELLKLLKDSGVVEEPKQDSTKLKPASAG